MTIENKVNFQLHNKLAPELYAGGLVEISDGATQLNYGSWFVFKSPLISQLGDIFEKNSKYFYAASFITSSFAMFVYFFKFIVASNKNASKIANLVLRAISFSLLVIMSIGAGIFSAPFVTLALYASIMIFPMVHALKVFYFTFKCMTAEGEMQEFFYDKMIKNLQITVVSGLLIFGFAALFIFSTAILATPFGAPILMAIGVVGALIMVAAQIWKLIPVIKGLLSSVPEVETGSDRSPSSARVIASKLGSPTLTTSEPTKTRLIAPAEAFNYWQYALTPIITDLSAFEDEIRARQTEITNNKGTHIWLEHSKLNNKVKALEFLLAFVKVLDEIPASATKKNPFKIANVPFDYENKEALVKAIEKYILSTYHNTYESRGKHVGVTQVYFRAVFSRFLKGAAADAVEANVPVTPRSKASF